MNVRVKNLNGTTGRKPPDGSKTWEEYWANKKGYTPVTCSSADCYEDSAVGGHVKKVGLNDDSWYITPLCRGCNAKRDETFVVDSIYLVPVNP